MEPIDFLKVLRRRWAIVAGTTVLAVALALVTAPARPSGGSGGGAVESEGPRPTGYEATHTLVPYADPFGLNTYSRSQQNLEVMALYVKRGEVPERAAARLGFPGDPALLARQVTSKVDVQSNSISISTSGSDAEAVVELANTFAEELLGYLTEQQGEQYQRALDDALARADALRADLQQVDSQLARQEPPGDTVLRSQRDALARQYSSTFERYQQLNGQGAPPPPLMTAQAATAEPLIAERSPVRVPSDRGGRSLIAALLGLMVGAGAAVGVDRLDTRPRTKEQFEETLGLPVLAEIPRLGRRRPGGLVTRQAPASPSAEAFRVLRASLPLLAKPAAGVAGHAGPPQVFLVTSPSSGDGKTTVVANLAASFAEAGRSVLVLDCDFWRPTAHGLLGVKEGPGVLDALASPSGPTAALAAAVQQSWVPGLSVVSAGTRPEVASELLRQAPDLIAQARRLAEIVIIDTGPLLGSSSATELVPTVDSVVLVARAGRTRPSAARRTVEMLGRLDAPTLGVVLMGVERPLHKSSYHYYARPPAPRLDDDEAPARAPLTPLPAIGRDGGRAEKATEAEKAREERPGEERPGGEAAGGEGERRWLELPEREAKGGREAARWSR